MSSKQQRPLADMLAIAEEIVAALAPFTERILIAGSIRREKAMVSDIEIVCIPKTGPAGTNLFGEPVGLIDHVDAQMDRWKTDGIVADRLDKNGRPSWGLRYKRALYNGIPLDLFSTRSETWGVIATIRTGPADFSQRLVTSRLQGGHMPPRMRIEGAWLYDGATPVPTPEEQDLFDAVGLTWIDPKERV